MIPMSPSVTEQRSKEMHVRPMKQGEHIGKEASETRTGENARLPPMQTEESFEQDEITAETPEEVIGAGTLLLLRLRALKMHR